MLVRDDLPRGFLAAQVVHAADESAPGRLDTGLNAVVLAVPDESALSAIADRLAREGIVHRCITEPDAPYFGQLTAIGLRPATKEALRPYLSSLRLLA